MYKSKQDKTYLHSDTCEGPHGVRYEVCYRGATDLLKGQTEDRFNSMDEYIALGDARYMS